MAGIGEKPATRSGPNRLTVETWAAAIISIASSQLARTNPPLPRWDLYVRARPASSTIASHASTGSPVRSRSDLYISSRLPRTYGCFTRRGEYVYQENDAPRGQPRGS